VDLSGVLIPAVTPFSSATGELDLQGLRSNIRGWVAHPVRGIVIAGSTGEAVFLERDERRMALDAARSAVPSDRLLVAGAGAESTRATIRLTSDAADAGADAVLVQPPAFYRGAMTPDVLRDHYRAVADASHVPVILYQVPLRFATLELVSGLVAELSEHPNIVGVKDSRGDLASLGEYVTRTRSGFQVLAGNGAGFYAGLEVGAVGGILGVANLVPGQTSELHRAFTAGRGAEAGRLQERVGPLHEEIVGKLGVPGVKRALDFLGYRGGAPRLPLKPLDDHGEARVRELLSAAGLLDRTPPESGTIA
jgi:4-hydroxy-2-oxoglutarate aldolase